MELLIDKAGGAVGPEPGPNMMWNAKYGMMGQGNMMGMTLAPRASAGVGGYAEARRIAQRRPSGQNETNRLPDQHRPGRGGR